MIIRRLDWGWRSRSGFTPAVAGRMPLFIHHVRVFRRLLLTWSPMSKGAERERLTEREREKREREREKERGG